MVSNCDLGCFSRCAFPMNVTSGHPATITSDLDSMGRCMSHVCELDYLDKNTTELAHVYQQLSSAMASFSNETSDLTNCTYNQPIVAMDRGLPQYAVPILGYLSPIIIFLTVINNSLVFIVLMKPHMRSPTNAILVAMALSDLFTGLCPLPIFLHFHATQRFYEWVPYTWCYPSDFLASHFPTIFHTASIWLTVALTVQRYICVCHPFKARTWCNVRNVIYGTVVIYIVATLTEITRFFDSYYVETEVPSLLQPNQYVSACVFRFSAFVAKNLDLYFNIYYWCRVIFVNVLPCLGLLVMNALLIHTLRVARRRRQQLLVQHQNKERGKLEESNNTTLMLVVVVCLFLLVEIPMAGITICVIIQETLDITVMERDTFVFWSVFTKFFVLLSYPLNFFIYCSLCKKFRDTFKQLFIGSSMPLGKKDSQYETVYTKKSSCEN